MALTPDLSAAITTLRGKPNAPLNARERVALALEVGSEVQRQDLDELVEMVDAVLDADARTDQPTQPSEDTP